MELPREWESVMGEQITEEAIEHVLTGILQSAKNEIAAMSQDDLEQRWYFRWDKTRSVTWNVYQFNEMLVLYKRSCREWEETHNGSVCVVERVRDKYLIPKIAAFVAELGSALTPPNAETNT